MYWILPTYELSLATIETMMYYLFTGNYLPTSWEDDVLGTYVLDITYLPRMKIGLERKANVIRFVLVSEWKAWGVMMNQSVIHIFAIAKTDRFLFEQLATRVSFRIGSEEYLFAAFRRVPSLPSFNQCDQEKCRQMSIKVAQKWFH